MSKPILVTGATGFLGLHVCEQLRDAGQTVRAIGRSTGDAVKALGLEYIQGSILEDDALAKAVAECDAVFHLAGMVSRDPRDAPKMAAVHVEGTRRVIQAAGAAGVRKIVYASSSGTIACSKDRRTISDETRAYPMDLLGRWPYYETKVAAEKIALSLPASLGVELVCINPSLILGPGDTWGSSTNDVLQLLAGKIPAVPPGGLSLVDVRDVATAALNALDRGRSGERYLLGAANWTLRTFIEQVGEIGQVRVPRMGVPGWLTVASAHLTEPLLRAIGQKPALDVPSAQMSRLYWYCDSSKAKADIGFRPRAPQETLGDTIGDLRSRGLVT